MGPDALELARLAARWPEIVSPRIAAKTAPASLQKTTLVVHVCDAQWLHELSYLRQDLLDRVAPHVQSVKLRAIALRLGPVDHDDLPSHVATKGVPWHGQQSVTGLGPASELPETPFVCEASSPESSAALKELLDALREQEPELYERAMPLARPVERGQRT